MYPSPCPWIQPKFKLLVNLLSTHTQRTHSQVRAVALFLRLLPDDIITKLLPLLLTLVVKLRATVQLSLDDSDELITY